MPKNLSIHGLRGLAALLVFVYHIQRSVLTGGFSLQPDETGVVFAAIELGRLGVDLFFMISGMLITASLSRHASVGRFLRNRATRIYPAFLAPHLLVFTLGPLIGYAWMANLRPHEYVVHFVSNLLMLPGVFPLPIAQIVAWSLSYEAAFYLLAASAFALARRERGPLELVGWALWLALTSAALWYHPRGWFFVAGVVAYRLNAESQAGYPTWPGEKCAGLGALLLMGLLYEGFFPAAVVLGGVGFLAVARQRDLLSRCLQTPALLYLGTISYSFYLWHSVVFFGTKRVFGYGGGLLPHDWLNLVAFTLVSFAASLAAAHGSYALIETRLTRWLLHRADKMSPVPTLAMPSVSASRQNATQIEPIRRKAA